MLNVNGIRRRFKCAVWMAELGWVCFVLGIKEPLHKYFKLRSSLFKNKTKKNSTKTDRSVFHVCNLMWMMCPTGLLGRLSRLLPKQLSVQHRNRVFISE